MAESPVAKVPIPALPIFPYTAKQPINGRLMCMDHRQSDLPCEFNFLLDTPAAHVQPRPV